MSWLKCGGEDMLRATALIPTAAVVGWCAHAACMTVGYGYDLGYAVLALASVILAVLVGLWAAAGTAARAGRASLALAGAAVATLPAWWAGWPMVLGLVAATVGLTGDRRSWLAVAGILLGLAAMLGAGIAALLG